MNARERQNETVRAFPRHRHPRAPASNTVPLPWAPPAPVVPNRLPLASAIGPAGEPKSRRWQPLAFGDGKGWRLPESSPCYLVRSAHYFPALDG
jgi:hypothetical protein